MSGVLPELKPSTMTDTDTCPAACSGAIQVIAESVTCVAGISILPKEHLISVSVPSKPLPVIVMASPPLTEADVLLTEVIIMLLILTAITLDVSPVNVSTNSTLDAAALPKVQAARLSLNIVALEVICDGSTKELALVVDEEVSIANEHSYDLERL